MGATRPTAIKVQKYRTGAGIIQYYGRIAGLALSAILSACDNNSDTVSVEPAISLTTELGGTAEGYERACEAREFSFPTDHGAHPEYRNEWWYVCLLYTSPSPRDGLLSRMPSSA